MNCCHSLSYSLFHQLAYITQAEQAWNTAWEILHDNHGWKHKDGHNLDTGKVYSKNYKGLGVMHKLEVILRLASKCAV